MTDTVLALIGIGIAIVIATIFYFTVIYPSRVFEKFFGVNLDSAKQEDVNKVIESILTSLHKEEKKPQPLDYDKIGYFESELKQAKKLAEKYNFTVPE
jgi:hypothetical protein